LDIDSQVVQGNRELGWLSLNLMILSGFMPRGNSRKDIKIPLNEQLIVEKQSR